MQVPWKALNWRHLGTKQCTKGVDRKIQQLAKTETRDNSERALRAYGETMEAVLEFRYLGRLLTATDNDWPEVVGGYRDRLEGSHREGGSSSRSGRARNKGVDGLGV